MADIDFELLTLLPPLPKCSCYRCEPPHLFRAVLRMKPKASEPGKCSANQATSPPPLCYLYTLYDGAVAFSRSHIRYEATRKWRTLCQTPPGWQLVPQAVAWTGSAFVHPLWHPGLPWEHWAYGVVWMRSHVEPLMTGLHILSHGLI